MMVLIFQEHPIALNDLWQPTKIGMRLKLLLFELQPPLEKMPGCMIYDLAYVVVLQGSSRMIWLVSELHDFGDVQNSMELVMAVLE